VAILNILSNLLDLTGVKSYYQTGLQGLVLILVVVITTISASRQNKKSGMLRTFH
jgi:ribose/xylose/arabinose/galactoside ABC-type transport system permease subunit